MAEKELKPLDPAGEDLWNDFLKEREHTYFHTLKYMKFICQVYPDLKSAYSILMSEGEARGIIPLFYSPSIFWGKKISPVQFNMYGGPLLDDPGDIDIVAKELFTLFPKSTYIAFRDYYGRFPSSRHNRTINADAYFTIVKLSKKENLAKLIYRERFIEKIRSLKKNNALSFRKIGKDELHDLYCLSVKFFKKRFGVSSYPEKYFEIILDTIVKGGNGELIGCFLDKRLIAGTFFIKYRNSAIYMWGCYDLALSHLSPIALLLDHQIIKLASEGYKELDLGQTQIGNQGLLFFKENLGGVHRKLNKVYIPKAKSFRIPAGDNSFSIAKNVFRVLPDWLVKTLTPLIFRLYR
ncbi:GNAT family N-acetyltransferase [Candidatus Calescamantes bacterium]|nr:GNAT family N-acetyltransferase [Candidatus Calescamantes bacterium]MCK5598913.1 GNAT family N-acetyltransferase [bacterium]